MSDGQSAHRAEAGLLKQWTLMNSDKTSHVAPSCPAEGDRDEESAETTCWDFFFFFSSVKPHSSTSFYFMDFYNITWTDSILKCCSSWHQPTTVSKVFHAIFALFLFLRFCFLFFFLVIYCSLLNPRRRGQYFIFN